MPRKTGKEKTINIRFKSSSLFFWIASAVFVVDRVLKILAEQNLHLLSSYPVAGSFFSLTLVHNTGAAFGLWKGAGPMLILSTLLIVLVFLAKLFFSGEKELPRAQRVFWALIVGGALGNMYDRVKFGYVIDYLDFRVWPVFNMADSAICIGVFCLIISQLRATKP